MESQRRSPATAQLCLNYNSQLVRRLAGLCGPDSGNSEAVRRSVEVLFVQALLMAQQPLTTRELAVLSGGIMGLVEWAVTSKEQSP